MSGVLLTSRGAAPALTPSIDDQVKQRLETPPTVARTFESEDVLTAYAEVYDGLEAAHDMAMTTRVVNVDGSEVFRVSGQQGSSEEFGYQVAIPLGGVGPGHYLLQIEARPTAGDDFALRELSFEVARHVADVEPEEMAPSPPAAPEPHWSTPRLTSRIDRLEAWLEAVDRARARNGRRAGPHGSILDAGRAARPDEGSAPAHQAHRQHEVPRALAGGSRGPRPAGAIRLQHRRRPAPPRHGQ